MSQAFSDRNLLLGVVAWKLGFISRDQFLTGMSAWAGGKATSLGDALIELGTMTPERRDVLEALVDAHVQAHDHSPQKSLAVLGPLGDLGEQLRELGAAELTASLAAADQTTEVAHLAGPAASPGSLAETIPLAADVSQYDARLLVGAPSSGGRRFVILREHAQGGLGRVSVARDQELNREVALKEVRPERAHDVESQRRLILEAEITGGLEHPGLAPVYGLGTFPDGRPYYAMRFIRGESLSAAIERFHARWRGIRSPTDGVRDEPARSPESERALELRRLLGRFLDVCQAIHYAHSRGVIHRDLKPSNVMLGRYGETLVVDWGLAKAIGQRASELRHPQQGDSPPAESPLCPRVNAPELATRLGAAVGTPAYMSPEQAAGRSDQVGPSSDIYSLGCTLFCILTGQPPFFAESKEEMLDRARRGAFSPPRSVNTSVPRALEAICLKAMAFEPQARYASAAALSEDIERFLADEPVSACREPLADRARRWVRKHRSIASSVAASILVALVAVTVGLLIVGGLNSELAVANSNLVAANEAETKAHQRTRNALYALSDDVIAELMSRQDRYQLGENEKRFLRTLLGFFAELAAAQGPVSQAGYDQASGYLRVGIIRQHLGEYQEAEAAYREAEAMFQRLVVDFPDLPAHRDRAAVVQSNLGTLLELTSRPREAEAAYRAALAIQQQLAAEFPERTSQRSAMAGEHTNLGNVFRDTGRPREAEAAYGEAVAIFRQLATEVPAAPQYRRDLAKAQNNRGMLLANLNRSGEAQAAYGEALALLTQLAAEFPHEAAYRYSLVLSHTNLGHELGDTGRPGDAEAAYQQALSNARQLAADFPTVPAYRHGLAVAQAGLADHLRDAGKGAEAETAYREAIAVLKRLAADFPTAPTYRESLALDYNSLGILLREAGRMTEAEAAYRDGLAIQEKLVGDVPANPGYRQELGRIHHNIGALLYFQGRHKEAQAAYYEALDLRRKLAAEFPREAAYRRDIAKSHETLALLLEAMRQPGEAETSYREALAAWQSLTAEFPRTPSLRHEHARCQHNLGMLLQNQDRLPEAEAAYREAMSLWQKLATDFPAAPDHRSNVASMLINLAKLKNLTKDQAAAKKLLEQARPHHQAALAANGKHPVYRQALRENHLTMCSTLSGLGDHVALEREAGVLARSGIDQPNDLYQGACFTCICARIVNQDAKLTEAQRQQAAKAYADKAMTMLAEAVAAGFSNTGAMRKALALVPLREREEFQKLLNDMESRSKSLPPKQKGMSEKS
jgi:serine/threonine-protein kinase